MKIVDTKLTRITIPVDELKKHVSKTYADIIQDVSVDDPYMMQGMCNDYSDIITNIDKGTLKLKLQDGYSMTVLPDDVFVAVEEYFKNRKIGENTELQIVIIDEKLDILETIHEDYIQY